MSKEVARRLWCFGYGSILWKHSSDIPHDFVVEAYCKGVKRRLWQASHDHRGTPENPGRVCTLVRAADDHMCFGLAFRVLQGKETEVRATLDFREKDGYTPVEMKVFLKNEEDVKVHSSTVDALVYIGQRDNPSFRAPENDDQESINEIANIVKNAVGPSGTNVEYVVNLQKALEARGVVDDHIAQVAALIQEQQQPDEKKEEVI